MSRRLLSRLDVSSSSSDDSENQDFMAVPPNMQSMVSGGFALAPGLQKKLAVVCNERNQRFVFATANARMLDDAERAVQKSMLGFRNPATTANAALQELKSLNLLVHQQFPNTFPDLCDDEDLS